MENYCRFAPPVDTIPNDSIVYEAWIKYQASRRGYGKARKFTRFKMFYGYNTQPVEFELYNGEELVMFETLDPNNSLKTVTWNFPVSPEEITLKFKGKDSPDVYGVLLDGNEGIAVDNIPLRGSSGLEFTRLDLNQLSQFFQQMNVKCLILQFGLNVVPHIVEDYTFYENRFYRQLKTLKNINPDMAVIVIGVSDMSKKEGDYYESYPNIEKIRNAQRNAAFRAKCAFWDLYEAMGGKNSMPSWVFADPPLAGKDFTHFNYKGAQIVAQMFYNALIYEYQLYVNR